MKSSSTSSRHPANADKTRPSAAAISRRPRALAGSIAVLLAGLALWLPANASAQTITWTPAADISGDTDVDTQGTLVGAFALGPTGVASTTVNGVTFTGQVVSASTTNTFGNYTFTSSTAVLGGNSDGSTSAPFTSLSAAYQALLSSDINQQDGNPMTLTISGLTVGGAYQFEWWNSFSEQAGSPLPTAATAGNSVTLIANTTSAVGGLGQFSVGTFTATSASEQITFTGPDGQGLNAFELRLAPAAALPATDWLGGASGAWTGANWASDSSGTSTTATPTSSDAVTFSASGAMNQNTTLGANFTIQSLTIDDTAAVTINAGGAFTLTISGSAGTGITVNSGAGLLTINADVTFAGSSDTITVSNTAGAIINGVIGGGNGLIKAGSGTLTLGSVNDYTGATTISAGTIQLGIANALPTGTTLSVSGSLDLAGFNQQVASVTGSGTVTDSGGAATFTVSNSGADTFAGTITGANLSLTMSGAGTLTLTSANTYGGATTISAGTIADGINNALTTTTALSVAGTLDLAGFNQQVASVTGSGTVTDSGGAATFTVNNSGADSFAGSITGTNLSLTKSGAGTLTLTSANTYGGATTISAGTIADGINNALTTTTALSVAGTLDLAGFNQQVASVTGSGAVTDSGGAATFTVNNSGADSFAGAITGASLSLTKSGAGTLTLTSANSYGGATTISAGTIADGINNALPTTTALAVAGTLDLAGFNQQVASVTGSGTVTDSGGAATFTVNNSGADSFAGTITGASLSLTKSGAGTLTLTSANTYGGATTISAGTIADGVNNALTTTTALSVTGTLNLAGFNQQVASVTGSGTVTNSAGAATFTANNSGADSFAGSITGANLSLTKSGAGTLTLSGANTYAGVTTVNAGVLSVSSLANGGVASNIGAATNAAGNLVLDGGTLQYTGNSVTIDRGFTASNKSVINVSTNGQTLTMSGAVNVNGGGSGGSGLTIMGNLTLTGTVSLDNSPNSNNALNLAAGATLTTSGTVTNPFGNNVFQGGTLNVAGGTFTTNTVTALGNAAGISGSTLTVSGGLFDQTGGAFLLGQSDAGTVNLNGGTFETAVQLQSSVTGNALNFNGGALQLSATLANLVSTPADVAMTVDSGGAIIDVNGHNLTISNALLAGSGNGGLTLMSTAGGGTLTLSGANAYTGATTITAGTIADGINNALPIGTALSVTGSLDLAGFNQQVASVTGSGTVTDSGGAATFTVNNSGADSFAGTITGANLSLTKSGAGTLTLTSANTYGAATTISAGTIADGISNALTTTTALSVSGTLDLAGFNQQVASITGPGTVTDSAGAATFTVNNSGADSFAGTITGANLAFVKQGAGTLMLGGTSTYSGTTDIQGGALQVNGSLGNTAVTVESGATLGGTGTISGAVTVMSGGILSPGDAPGTLTVGPLTLNSGSITNYQLSTPGVIGANVNGLTVVNGNLILGGTLNVSNAGSFGPGAYQLFQYTGSLTNNTLAVGTVPATYAAANFIVVTGVANQVDLIVVPNGGAAATQFWDGTGPANNGVINGGSGTWSNFTANFADNNGNNNATWQNGIAVFATPSGGAAASTVTLSGAINFSGLMFTGDGYTINSDNVAGTSFTAIGLPTNTNNIASIFTSSGVTATINAVIGGTAGISKDGGGTLALTGVNTYSGGTTINAGVLSITNNGALSTGPVSLGTGGELNGAATMTLSNEVTFAATGNSAVSAAAGTTFSLSSVDLAGGNAVFGSAGNTGVVAIGSLTTAIVTSGSTIEVAYGTLQNGGGATNLSYLTTHAASTTVDLGATLDVNDNAMEVANLQGAGKVTLGINAATVLTVDAGSFSGVISGAGQLTSTGILTLTGANTYSAGTTITSGTLTLGNGHTPGASLGSNTVTINGGATLTLDLASGETFSNGVTDNGHIVADDSPTSNYTISSTISGSGDFTKTGGNTVTLTGNNGYQGGTTINGGALLVNNTTGSGTGSGPVVVNSGTLGGSGTIAGAVTLNSGGTIAPGAGSPGVAGTTLHAGSLLWNGGAALNLQLGATTSDQLALTGALTKGTAGLYSLNISAAGIAQTDYTLATFGSTTFFASDFTLALPTGYSGTLLETGASLDLVLAFAASGPVIQNSNPVGTPLIADFTVRGPVTTGSTLQSNTINSLIFTPGSSLQIFNTLTLTSGKVSDGGGISTITGGTLSGPNGLFFNLTGEMFVDSALQGDLTKTGTGSLFLNGALFGNAQVLMGLLGGAGSIFGNLSNYGTVSPGVAPGTLSVTGNYTQSKAGTLVIGIGGTQAGQFDALTIGGKASLNGTLQLVRFGNFNLQRGDTITFLTAGQGITGTFSTVINPFVSQTILEPEVIYGASSVALEMVQGSFATFARRDGLSPNDTAVAAALDSVAFDPRADKLIAYLDNRNLTKLPGDFERISPDQLTSIFQVGTSFSNVQSLNLQQRTEDIRSGSSGFSAFRFAMTGNNPSYSGGLGYDGPVGPVGPEDKESKVVFTPQPAPPDTRWGAFLSGTGEWANVGDTANARGYDLQTGGFTIGLDYKVTPHLAIGVSAGYTGTGVDLADHGRVFVNGGKFGLYGTYFDGGFYTDAAINGGYNSYDTYRSALDGHARGNTDGGELNALFGTGYDWKKAGFTFGPTATFNYTNVRLNSFEESGSLAPLDIQGGNGESLRSAFGAKVSYDWKVLGVMIKPEIRAAWQHEFGDTTFALDSNFANGAGNVFTTSGPTIGRDSLLLSGGFAIQWSERFSTYLYYDGELARANYQESSVSGGCRVDF